MTDGNKNIGNGTGQPDRGNASIGEDPHSETSAPLSAAPADSAALARDRDDANQGSGSRDNAADESDPEETAPRKARPARKRTSAAKSGTSATRSKAAASVAGQTKSRTASKSDTGQANEKTVEPSDNPETDTATETSKPASRQRRRSSAAKTTSSSRSSRGSGSSASRSPQPESEDTEEEPPKLDDFDSVGKYLGAMRVFYGENLDDVARDLKLQRTYLRAIEAGDYQRLPGRAYAVGFVRAYAAHYGLDTQEIVEHFKNEAEPVVPNHKGLHYHDEESKLPRGRVAMLSIIMAALLYGGWFLFSQDQEDVLDPVAEPPSGTQPGSQDPASSVRNVASSQESGAPLASAADSTPAAIANADQPAPRKPDAPSEGSNAELATPSTATSEPTGTTAEPREALATSSTRAEAAAPETTPLNASARDAMPDDSIATRAASEGDPGTGAVQTPASDIRDQQAVLPPSSGSDGATDRTSEPGIAPLFGTPGGSASTAESTPGTSAGGDLQNDEVADGILPDPGESLAVAPPAVVRQVVASGGGVLGAEGDLGRVILRATGDSWIRVRAPDRSTYWTGIMKAGDALAIPDLPGYRMNTGNAGAIEFIVDGQLVDPVGPSGTVRRNVVLEPVPLMQGTAYSRQSRPSSSGRDSNSGNESETPVVPWRNPDDRNPG